MGTGVDQFLLAAGILLRAFRASWHASLAATQTGSGMLTQQELIFGRKQTQTPQTVEQQVTSPVGHGTQTIDRFGER